MDQQFDFGWLNLHASRQPLHVQGMTNSPLSPTVTVCSTVRTEAMALTARRGPVTVTLSGTILVR